MTNNYAIAQEALKRGWCVFPCGPDKKPITAHGFKDATRDQAVVLNWWKAHPESLIGIPCEINDIWALDLDRKNGADGIANFQNLTKAHGGESVQAGPMQSTPSGGLHLIFKLGPRDIPQSAGKIAPGIDVRSAGYVCSGTLPDGRAYTWQPDHGIDAPLTEAPAWLLDVVGAYKFDTSKIDTSEELKKPANTPQGSIDYWLDKYLSQATIGRRNETGFNLACQVRDAGYSQVEAEALPYPERVPQAQGKEYTHAEWLESVRSAFTGSPREPARKQGGMMADKIYFEDPPEPEPHTTPQEAPRKEQQPKADIGEWVDPWSNSWHTLADAFTPRPPQTWAIDDLIKLPSLNAFYGNPGDLKTMLLMDMALCIAAGYPFLLDAPWQSGGRIFEVNPYPVLWLDFDNGEEMTCERFEALARARGIDPALPNLHFVSMPSPWLILGDPKSIGHLTHQIKYFAARAVFIDNLGTTKGGAKENTDEMIPVMSNLRQMVNETKTATTFVHHETKNGAFTARRGDSLRGHSSIEAAVDLALLVEREPGSDLVTVQSTKTRGVDVAPFSAVWTYTHKPGTSELETAIFYGMPCENKKSPQAIEAAIKEALADGPILKTKLAKEVHEKTEGIGLNRIRDYIERMINTEAIATTPGGKTTGELCVLR